MLDLDLINFKVFKCFMFQPVESWNMLYKKLLNKILLSQFLVGVIRKTLKSFNMSQVLKRNLGLVKQINNIIRDPVHTLLLYRYIQPNLRTKATLGTQKHWLFSKVIITHRLSLKNYYQYWNTRDYPGRCRQVVVVQRLSLTQVK